MKTSTKKLNEPANQGTTYLHDMNKGDRHYKVKSSTLKTLLDDKSGVSQFEKHLIQEGIKQVLFTGGTDESINYIYDKDGYIRNEYVSRKVPKEMIQFLLDHDVIEVNQSWITTPII